jgi:hypothetical protein
VRGTIVRADGRRRRRPGAVGNGGFVAYRARSPLWRPGAKHAQAPPSPLLLPFRGRRRRRSTNLID